MFKAEVKGINQTLAHLAGMGKQVRYAASRALNAAAFAAMREGQKQIEGALDRPTRWTLKSWYVRKKADKNNLVASVGWSDYLVNKQFKGPDYYLAQHFFGGRRKNKRFEDRLISARLMPAGMQVAIGKAAQDNFTSQSQAINTGLANAAAAQPGIAAGTSGAAVADPNAFLANASAAAMASNASTMQQMSEWQGMMGTLQQTTYSQGQIAALSDYAKGLPALYARKRQEAIDGIDKYIAEQAQAEAELALEQAKFAETQRSNRVDESIRATNAQTNAAVAFGNLGISATREGRLGHPEPPPPVYDNVPEGYVQLPDGTIKSDPTYVAPDTSGPGGTGKPGRGEYPPNQLRKEGYRPLPKGAGPKYRRNATVATDGSLWFKPGTAAKPKTPGGKDARDIGTLAVELKEKYSGSSDPFSSSPGWVETFDGDVKKVTNAVVSWVLNNRKSFTNADGTFNAKAARQVLDALGGTQGNNTTSRVMRVLMRRIDSGGRLK
jgi:hypothetical protein